MWFFPKFIENHIIIQFEPQKKFAVLPCRTRLPYPKITLKKAGFWLPGSKTARAHYTTVKWQFDQPLRVLS